jgi:Leucine-rich repeat (LRR) protein
LRKIALGTLFIGETGNLFTGSIPAELCALTDMREIDLSSNLLTGTIPECIGSSLTSLNIFSVGFNILEGTIPTSFQELTLLRSMFISSNYLHGEFSSDWIQNLTYLTGLTFNDNNFSGTLAPSLSTLSNLNFIDGSVNGLTGPLPEFGNAPDLHYILLAYNQLTGTVPVSFSSLTALGK